ncbi:MAG: SdrD B-like domain-containing protein, partial [Kiritimatiellia bacterium]
MRPARHISGRRWGGLLAAAGWAWVAGAAQAQVQPITSAAVTYQTYADTNDNYSTTGGGSAGFPTGTVYNVRFNEGVSNQMFLGEVTVGGRTFDGVALAGDINIARTTNAAIKGEHHIVLYEQSSYSGSNVFLKSRYAATMEESLRSRLINHGADNVFSDQGDENGNNNNIQRIDYLFPDGLPVHSHIEQRGFLVMDRGGNDRFKIAAITGVAANGKPTAFGTPVSVLETNWGASGVSLDTIVMRGYTEDGDAQHPSADVSPQPLSGVFLNWQTLELQTNDLFYGYALVGNDTTTNNAYWTLIDNPAYFPTNTSPASTYGGLDLISGGLMFYDEALNVTLGDRAWDDLDADGLQDVGEPGAANVLVYVYDGASHLAAIVRTDTNGVWKSPGHGPGTYFAKYFLPAGYEFTARYAGADPAIDSDADLATGRTADFALTNGQTNLTLDAGMYRRAAIGDFVWEDLDGDGQQDDGEPGRSNVVVRLFNAASNVIGTTTSSAAGAYAFTNLLPGASYFVDFTPPAGYLFTTSNVGVDATDSDPLPGTNRTALIPLVSGQTNLTVDAGFYRLASLGDFTWNDANGNGQQDGGEPALANVAVRLYDAVSNVVGATTSSAAGAYALTHLVPGIYFVEFESPSGYIGTSANAGDDETDSDADPATGRTAPFLLPSGETDLTVDAGFGQPASLGDYTWVDSDFNGQQDVGEPALANVLVTLYDAASNVVGVATSTAAGAYAFADLPPGTYFAGFAPPAGYQFTTANLGDDATDSDPDPLTGRTAAIVLAGGQNDLAVDAGFVFPSALGDYTWVDSDFNGQQDGGEPALANVVVTLYSAVSNVVGTTISSAAGAYAFTNLPPGTYFVGFAPPAGFQFTTANVGADATDSDADPAMARTAPFALTNGQTDVTIDAGFYNSASVSLKLFKSSSLAGNWNWGETNDYYLTLQNTGTVALAGVALSDVLPPGVSFVAGSAQIVRLTAATTNPFVDTVSDGFGTVSYANNNGSSNWVGSWAEVGDNASAASGSVLVRVAGDTNALVFENSSADNDYATRTNVLAAAPGRVYTNLTLSFAYRRQNWDSGDSFTFYVSTNGFVGQSNLVFAVPTTSGNDASYVSVSTNLTSRLGANLALRLRAGGSFGYGDRINVDFVTFANSGIDVATNLQTAYGPGVTVSVVSDLASATPTNLLSNYTLAAGTTVTVRIRTTLGAPLVSTQLVNTAMATNPATPPLIATATNYAAANAVGDRAWLDADANGIQDGSEPGLAGVAVRLYGGSSNLLATTSTGADGAYGFSILPTGLYFLEFVPPADHWVSLQDQGGDDALDSDIHTDTGRTAVFALSGGTHDTSRDAGFFQTATLGDYVWEDVDRDGQQDAGEPALAGGVVTLYNAASNAIGIVTSSASGAYAFADLVPGSYFTGFAAPAGYGYTPANAGDDATDSDADPTTGFTAPVTLASGQTNGTVDAGFFQTVAIGDWIWFDEDRDGIQDAGETNGIPNIPVALLDTNGTIVAETAADLDGNYLFANMPTGTYVVRFDLTSLTTNEMLSPFNVGSDDAVD